jgi:serine/threonine protein kinase
MKSVGRYELLDEIGRGGMGIVYLARQHGLDRLVALKELHTIHASAPDIVQRFVRESRLAGSLNHPNIVTVHDYVEEDGTSYIAMEYMPRGSLRPWVGDLSLAQLAGVLEGLLAGLAAVEPSGIVHRDLKPENVMVAADGRVKITDFGIAKATQSAGVVSFMTATGTTVGTPAYMAPEQALSQEIGPWTDLYSVGVMTYEQLVGHLPFKDSVTPMAILLRHVNDPIPPVLDIRPDLDPALSEWVGRLLVKDPAERTRSATEAWEELEEIVLDLLGPRWRREARLPERGSAVDSSKPLTPAPFGSGSRTPAQPEDGPQTPAQPEIESGFLSYGRAPTGVGPRPRPAPSGQPPGAPPVSSRLNGPDDQPASSQRDPKRKRAPSDPERMRAPSNQKRERSRTSDRKAPARTRRSVPPRTRLVGAIAFIALLTGATGFVLAPAGKNARANAPGGVHSSQTSRPGPSRAYATALSNAISKLNRERAVGGARLAHATTANAQAAAALSLARAHDQAAAAVRDAATGPLEQTTNVAIATALADIGRDYSAMAGAAKHEDRHSFDDARAAVTTATASFAAALVRLHRLGYALGS